jgi:outer membrane immunogenic protein
MTFTGAFILRAHLHRRGHHESHNPRPPGRHRRRFILPEFVGCRYGLKAAPVIAPVTTWTGLYLGVHGGAAWQSAPNWSAVDPNGVTASATLPGSTNLGAVGGIQGGYNWQFAPAWVVGVEGDISWASLGDHRTVTPVFLANGPAIPGSSLQMSANTQWLASARGKFGYAAWNNTLLYVTGGAAWANIEYNTHGTAPGVGVTQTTDFSTTTTKAG